MTSQTPESAEDHYYAGIDFFGEGKLPEAIAEYTRALELDPKFSDALHGLAQAYHAQQDFDRSIETARRILALDPDDILAWTTISRAYQRKGMVPEAEEAGNKARILGWKQQLKDQKANTGGA
ncbi:MAG TPA: tetratricopeptide repeat protein [Candidatus Acidoferrales bacterium]|nr:tetratricopeptide repeat protein [Candidatus Acidoferrales bacterium]